MSGATSTGGAANAGVTGAGGATITGGMTKAGGATNTGGSAPVGGSASQGGTTTGGATTLQASTGLCQTTCNKDCEGDADCDISAGQLCCDFGSAGKACVSSALCPASCTIDKDCAAGQACVLPSVSATNKACAKAGSGVQACSADADCANVSTAMPNICCSIYKQDICLPASQCPQECEQSIDCNTINGEFCCTTVRLLGPDLNVPGLCLSSTYNSSCPKTCSNSAECNTATGEICCDGLCSKNCATACERSADCPDQLCCKSALTRLPKATPLFSRGPRCAGTPEYTTCAPLVVSTSCNAIPGCTWSAAAATCTGELTPCGQLSVANCTKVAGCWLTST
jgi:hypothetical protein